MAEYHLAPAAERDLEGIWVYTVQRWNVEQAHRYIDIFTAAFSALAQSPRTFPACDYIRPGYRCSRIERHMVYFRVTDYGISIIRVLHDRMDALRYL
ncbi:type II toxin-antitoxin system RelE/ParE family toxin [Pseudomonas carnis]|uniref:type II toxin-antitoxin system RelE/ParE family toxin n=1 Tax=Pseudomonas TaxID=286 RepID=UPI000F574796|nr:MULTISPECIES: type II toxin-antitoxin system RelE/ParE family toxin [Pseudomonas]MBY8952563.1 type II toxin-antitoxin system RelE/ParE family toxin [Pseudomonas carnis]